MNKLKGKVEAYVISTMEDNQRTSLLDNLAISVEKVEDEANNSSTSNNENKIIKEGDVINDFIESLLAVFNHELKHPRSKNKPSFWYVAETISPKDTTQMIYRLNMRQSDQSRCQAWIRNSLKEGSLGSYLAILSEDLSILKEHYKPASFVRDTIKMDSAKSLINFAISSIDFEIEIEPRLEKEKLKFRRHIDPEVPQDISYLRTSSISSIEGTSRTRRKKTRGSSARDVIIAESPIPNGDYDSMDTISYTSVDSYSYTKSSYLKDKIKNEELNPKSGSKQLTNIENDQVYDLSMNSVINLDSTNISINTLSNSDSATPFHSSIITNQNDSSVTSKQNDSSIITNQNDSSIITNQNVASIITKQNYSSIITNKNDSSIITNQNESSIINNQNDASIITNQNDASIITNQNDASIITNQNEQNPTRSLSLSAQINDNTNDINSDDSTTNQNKENSFTNLSSSNNMINTDTHLLISDQKSAQYKSANNEQIISDSKQKSNSDSKQKSISNKKMHEQSGNIREQSEKKSSGSTKKNTKEKVIGKINKDDIEKEICTSRKVTVPCISPKIISVTGSPTITVSGSLNHSHTSLFQPVLLNNRLTDELETSRTSESDPEITNSVVSKTSVSRTNSWNAINRICGIINKDNQIEVTPEDSSDFQTGIKDKLEKESNESTIETCDNILSTSSSNTTNSIVQTLLHSLSEKNTSEISITAADSSPLILDNQPITTSTNKPSPLKVTPESTPLQLSTIVTDSFEYFPNTYEVRSSSNINTDVPLSENIKINENATYHNSFTNQSKTYPKESTITSPKESTITTPKESTEIQNFSCSATNINVSNQEVVSPKINASSSLSQSLTSLVETEYRNQEEDSFNEYRKEVKGSSRLVNILNSTEYNPKDTNDNQEYSTEYNPKDTNDNQEYSTEYNPKDTNDKQEYSTEYNSKGTNDNQEKLHEYSHLVDQNLKKDDTESRNEAYNLKDNYYVPGIHTSSDINPKALKRSFTTPSKFKNITSFSYTNENHFGSNTKDNKQRSNTMGGGGSTSWDPNYSFSSSNQFDDSESDTCSTSDQSFSILADLGITDDFIGLKEDHFSSPDTFMGFSSTEELENAIAMCKQLIKEATDKSSRKRDLVVQLVNLRLRLHEAKEKSSDAPAKTPVKKILGHQFIKQGKVPSTMVCDSCAVTIFPLLQTVYMCKDCGFHCHRKCLKQIDKPCVSSVKSSLWTYELRINPINSLSTQDYRCADCHKRFILNQDGHFDSRLCDYTGQFYCTGCHWNETMVIPARIIHNWDFTVQKVSRQSKHSLLLMTKKPIIHLKKLNPALFNFVEELRDVRTLREQILMMKKYMTSCRIATEERLLLTLRNRQHFVDNCDIYSLQDLIDLNDNLLLDELTRKHTTFSKHIKFDCLRCQGKGFICEICKSEHIIYPFDNNVLQCKCNAVLHRLCYSQKESCPRCERNEKRKSKENNLQRRRSLILI